MSQPYTPPGWYPDPAGGPGKAYWNGAAWMAMPAPQAGKGNVRTVLIALGCIVAVLIGYGLIHTLANGKGSFGSAPPAHINQNVSDGKFDFRVTNVMTDDNAGLSKARGKFVIVTMTVQNSGDKPQSFFAGNQKLFT